MKKLGVIGGLGPMASAYFLELLVRMTKAESDQEHPDVYLFSIPSTPDRTAYLLDHTKESPLPAMIKAGEQLSSLGVSAIAIPCVTSHYFYDTLSKAIPVPVIHAVRETARYLKQAKIGKAGILATTGTVETRQFQNALTEEGLSFVLPEKKEQEKVMELIYSQIKAGLSPDLSLFSALCDSLRKRGAETVILGCTELSLMKRDHAIGGGFLDVLDVLAFESLSRCEVPIREEYRDLIV